MTRIVGLWTSSRLNFVVVNMVEDGWGVIFWGHLDGLLPLGWTMHISICISFKKCCILQHIVYKSLQRYTNYSPHENYTR